jgi:HD-GYP domain-containing protein (c-di-GMP phosphodiesterase class II)
MKYHHERWSGGGYPDGLKGEEIPLHARIIQIADSYDAMTTNRPYQRAMRPDAAAARINELSGKVCDPRVVEAFNRAFRSGDLEAEALRPGAPTARAIRERAASPGSA